MSLLKKIVEEYMEKVSGIEVFCERCLRTERWGGSVVLMVVDAAFDSIGLNYFTAVVPKVEEFSKKYMENGTIKNLEDLAQADTGKLKMVWKNERSWMVAKEVASYLSTMEGDDRRTLRSWARNTSLEGWMDNPIGRIRGVGLITFQYLRMMGGVNTVMPDKIVKRVINSILREAGLEQVNSDIEFVKKTEEIALLCGYQPVELCWMTWLVQPEGKTMRMEKYSGILSKI
ncbi:MAG: hypothetical protein QG670_781 [Thermoproteota archaeon]|nr:hypothetical protein [Thermoproteota archaeon]